MMIRFFRGQVSSRSASARPVLFIGKLIDLTYNARRADRDVIVPKRDMSRAKALLVAQGYCPVHKKDRAQEAIFLDSNCALILQRENPRVVLDIHWDLTPRYFSRLSAKLDNIAVQDGYQIYHHSFLFDREGRWAVVQQGINGETGQARRYHWLSEKMFDWVHEPHAGIITSARGEPFNRIAHESAPARQASVVLALEKPWKNLAELKKLQHLELPAHHQILISNIQPDREVGPVRLKLV